ncbi:kinesin-domain-containing protein [Meredithblackwellia eburnea MCA 4105]
MASRPTTPFSPSKRSQTPSSTTAARSTSPTKSALSRSRPSSPVKSASQTSTTSTANTSTSTLASGRWSNISSTSSTTTTASYSSSPKRANAGPSTTTNNGQSVSQHHRAPSRAATLAVVESSADEAEVELGDEPVRRRGFGAPGLSIGLGTLPGAGGGGVRKQGKERKLNDSPKKGGGGGARRTAAETETEEEGGFATAKEGSLGSLVDGDDEGSDGTLDQRDDSDEEEEEGGKKENVVVCLRVRPPRQAPPSAPIYSFHPTLPQLSFTPSHPTFLRRGGVTGNRKEEYDFTFDKLVVSPPGKTQELFDEKIRSVVKAAMGGFNGTVFAYGQTASGKTHTMMGSPSEPGIIPLSIAELFSYIHKQKTRRSYTLLVSFLEIYNEQFRDLLALPLPPSANGKSVPLELQGDEGQLRGLAEHPVTCAEEVLQLLEEGEGRRRTGATDWNERSSRGHVVFMVTIESISKNNASLARTSRLNLIDLAGSESATGQADRLREGSHINKRVANLTAHIPYRDSKLTRLLQPALGGNARIAVVCTVSPDSVNAAETLSTLKFARRAKMVVTNAERGVLVSDQALLKQFAMQVEQLQNQIREREEDDKIARERDLAMAKVGELEVRGKQTEDALALKEQELARLREQLKHTQSFILTGPVLEETARRTSAGGATFFSPLRGKRVVSDYVGGIGLGTPRGSQSRIETRLEQQLADVTKELAEKQTELQALKLDVDRIKKDNSRLSQDHASAISQLEEEINRSTVQLKQSAEQCQSFKAALEEARAESSRLRTEKDQLTMDATSTSAKDRKSKEAKDEKISKLKTELQFVNRELSALVALHNRCPESLAALKEERDVALRSVKQLEKNLGESQELFELEAQRHEIAEQHTEKAKEAALSDLTHELKAVKKQLQREQDTLVDREGDLKSKDETIKTLQQVIDMSKQLEQQREQHVLNRRAGTDSLKSRLADLQALTSTPVHHHTHRSFSSSSSSSSDRDKKSNSDGPEQVAELQVRNGELVSRVAELEKALAEGMRKERKEREEAMEKERLNDTIERQRFEIETGLAESREWQQVRFVELTLHGHRFFANSSSTAT